MSGAAVALAAVTGAMIGSFLTVVAHRVPSNESIGGRSCCPNCGSQISAYDNVPVASWLILRGRSRCCAEPISSRYPLTELGVAALFAAVTIRFRDDFGAIALGFVFVSMLVAITLTDLERRIIPNRILIAATTIGVLIVMAWDPGSLPERVAAGVGAGGVLFLAALAYPGGMGMGDVKLAAAMGVFLGVDVIPALLVALLAGAIVGLGLIARRGAAARKLAIPFGPFLALGGVTGLFVGQALIDWYLRSFA